MSFSHPSSFCAAQSATCSYETAHGAEAAFLSTRRDPQGRTAGLSIPKHAARCRAEMSVPRCFSQSFSALPLKWVRFLRYKGLGFRPGPCYTEVIRHLGDER